MSFDRLLAAGCLRPRKTRRDDIRHLLQLAERDLADAAIPELSADRRFMIRSLVLAAIPQATKCGSRSNHPIPC